VTENWPISERHVHLQGGLLAINPPQSERISLWPTTTDNKKLELKLPTYGSLYSKLKALKLEIIGVEFITHEGEAIGSSPPQWRPYAQQRKIWINWDAYQLWGQLGNSAYSHKNGLFYDLSKRISYQLSSLSERLKELSLAYRAQLNALRLKDNPELIGRFQDGFTELTYQKFQSFLFESCILRDYLSELVYNFSRSGELKEKKEITTAGGLLKLLKKKADLTDLEAAFLDIMSSDGWLKELGDYRDLVMHSAPISMVNHKLYCIKEVVNLPSDKMVQVVRFPIPKDPGALYKERSRRDDFDRYVRQFELIAKAALEDYGKYDCLQYAHKVTNFLSNLALSCASLSPYKPMVQEFVQSGSGMRSEFKYVSS